MCRRNQARLSRCQGIGVHIKTIQLGIPRLPGRSGGGLPMPPTRPSGVPAGLLDRFGRQATDLRLSLTDKCNLRCSYCMPAQGLEWLSKQSLMTPDEIVRIVGISVDKLAIKELRLTGGEPLVRPDLVNIIRALRRQHPDLPISMTTNGVGLDKKAGSLKDAGLTRINVSLDSLHEETFELLTRRPFLNKVLAGVEAARTAGLGPIKINAVLMRGINDAEASPLLAWALQHDYELRFIEQMPLDADHGWTRRDMVTAAEIRELLSQEFILTPDLRERAGAPAERFQVRKRNAAKGESHGAALGTVGIIASVTEPFCGDCRRTRITAEGKLMSCLFSREEFDLLGLMRTGADDEEIARCWQDAMWIKPRAHGMDHSGLDSTDYKQSGRSMSTIGG